MYQPLDIDRTTEAVPTSENDGRRKRRALALADSCYVDLTASMLDSEPFDAALRRYVSSDKQTEVRDLIVDSLVGKRDIAYGILAQETPSLPLLPIYGNIHCKQADDGTISISTIYSARSEDGKHFLDATFPLSFGEDEEGWAEYEPEDVGE